MTAMTGASLEQLDQLSADYVTTSKAMLDKATQLNARIRTAITTFNSTMTTLGNETQALTGQIETEMSGLAAHAAGVEWTGNNRNAFNDDLGRMGQAVSKGTGLIREHTTTLRSKVESEFAPSLEKFSAGLETRMAANDQVNSQTSKAVADQRQMLDAAANSGWSA
jgi:hypothetical protein